MPNSLKAIVGTISMSMELPLGLWPVTLALLAVAGWSIWLLRKAHKLRERSVVALLVTSAIVFVVLPAYAVAFWADHSIYSPETQALPSNILGAFWWAYIVFVVLAVAFTKGHRLQAAGLAAFPLWLNFSIFFVCIMAVSGVWL